jgi:hypothetical protein
MMFLIENAYVRPQVIRASGEEKAPPCEDLLNSPLSSFSGKCKVRNAGCDNRGGAELKFG